MKRTALIFSLLVCTMPSAKTIPPVIHVGVCATGVLNACYRWHLHKKTIGMNQRREDIFEHLMLNNPPDQRQRTNLVGHMSDIKKYLRRLQTRTVLTNIGLLLHLLYLGYYLGYMHKQ